MNSTNHDDQQLRSLLRAHLAPDARARATPDFRPAVWRRIEARRATAISWPAWLRAHAFPMGAWTAACVAIAIFSAGILARSQSRHEREALIERYITSIAPEQLFGDDGDDDGNLPASPATHS